MHIVICDDEEEIAAIIKTYVEGASKNVEELQHSQVYTFHDAFSMLDYMERTKEQIDVIFMDIQLGNDNGIDLAKVIQEKQKEAKIVFVTGFVQQVENVFDAVPFQILLKPTTQEKITEVLLKVIAVKESEQSKYITVRNKDGIFTIDLKDILYVESRGRYIELNLVL